MLEINNLSVTYQGGVKGISNVNLSMEEGKVYGIVGPSGGGKSSLVKGILDLVPNNGSIRFRGKPMKDFAKDTAYVPQKDDLDKHFPLTVFQCVLMGTYPRLKMFQRPGMDERKATLKAIAEVGLSSFKNRQIGELSGGQFQRVLLARALAQNPLLYFMDEPFEGIDMHNEETIATLLKQLAKSGKTIFIIHHGLEKVMEYFDDIIMVNQKIIAHGPTKETFTDNNFKKTFHDMAVPFFNKESLKEAQHG